MLLTAIAGARIANPVEIENQNPGTRAWELSKPADAGQIEGYASLTSVNIGGVIEFFVNTVDPTFTIEIFRMGWYQGLGGRSVLGPVTMGGSTQAIPVQDPTNGLVECTWTNPYVLNVPSNWVSGIYLAKLTGSVNGRQSFIIFVVRDDPRASDLLFQQSVTTYQAYNSWPFNSHYSRGASLYGYNSFSGRPAVKVSFNRPYGRGLAVDSLSGVGAGDFLTHDFDGTTHGLINTSASGWELNMLRWLERQGYDVSYITDLDTHENPGVLSANLHKAFLSVGHDEYWSREMRLNVEAARDSGLNLGFFSGNNCLWQIRFEPDSAGSNDRTIVGYKNTSGATDPLVHTLYQTTTFGPLVYSLTSVGKTDPGDWPEEDLIGVSTRGGVANSDITIGGTGHWIFGGTGLRAGDKLAGLVGYEFGMSFLGLPLGKTILAHSRLSGVIGLGRSWMTEPVYCDMTIYKASSGAVVFNTGTVQWSWGLDDYNTGQTNSGPALRTSRLNPAAQQMTRNVLGRFISGDVPNLALAFDGTGGYVSTASASDLNAFPLTITAWIATTQSDGAFPGIVSKYRSGSGNGYVLFLHEGNVRAWYFRDPTNYVWDGGLGLNGGPISDGQWHHLAFTVDASGGSLYVDGALKDSHPWVGNPGAPDNGQDFHIGEYSEGYFAGQIDEVAVWNIARVQTNIAAGMYEQLEGNEPGLVAYWQFDEGAGKTANDATGHAHGASLVDGPEWRPVNRSTGFNGARNAISFDGRSQYIAVPQGFAFGARDQGDLNSFPLTIAGWLQTTQVDETFAGIVSKYAKASGNGYLIFLHEGNIRAWYFRDPTNYVWDGALGLNGGPINDGQWHHFAFTVDGGAGNLYIDGVLKDSQPWVGNPGAPTTGDLHLGEYGGDYFAGQLSEVSIWAASMKPSDLQVVLSQCVAGNELGLIACWRFDEGSGQYVSDTSGHDHTGRVWSMPTWLVSGVPTGQGNTTGKAPSSIAGKSIRFNVSDGLYQFAYNGKFTFVAAASNNTYTIIGDQVWTHNSSGTYSYSTTTRTSGEIQFNDSIVGSNTFYLAYFSDSTGSYAAKAPLTNGFQIGNFVVLGPTAPAVIIRLPTPGQRWSNSVFTVKGIARADVPVAKVYYRKSGDAWSLATTTNNWTNWTGSAVALVPGTNVIQAYAQDTSGVYSSTNTRKLDYVVTAPAVVHITGVGTLSPDYNGQMLELGRVYNMIATAATGYMFSHWTGSLTTSLASVSFRMISNLTLTANFEAVPKPRVAIMSPEPGQRLWNAAVTVIGSVSASTKVAGVFYQLNNNPWRMATTANGFTNWSAIALTAAGTNTVKAYALDEAGNLSATNALTFFSSNAFALNLSFSRAQPVTSDAFALSLGTATGLTCKIEVSCDFVNWIALTNFLTTAPEMQFRDQTTNPIPWRFYRAVLPLP